MELIHSDKFVKTQRPEKAIGRLLHSSSGGITVAIAVEGTLHSRNIKCQVITSTRGDRRPGDILYLGMPNPWVSVIVGEGRVR